MSQAETLRNLGQSRGSLSMVGRRAVQVDSHAKYGGGGETMQPIVPGSA
jgi:hypothetical protein